MTVITAVAQAIAEVSKVWYVWLKGKDRKKLKSAIEAAEKYIFVNEGEGEYKDIDGDKRDKLLSHFRKRFFKYN